MRDRLIDPSIRVIVHGGGSAAQAAVANARFVSMINRERPVLYIPVAMPLEIHSYSECRTWFEGHFRPFALETFTMWTDDDLSGKTSSDVDQFGGIYIGGGNTYKLLDTLRQTGFLPVLRDSIGHGVPYFGGSAGAIIVGRSIDTALDDEDIIGLDDLRGLRLVGDYLIGCHLRPDKEILFRQLAEQKDLTIAALPDDAALLLENGTLSAVGPDGASVKVISSAGTRVYPVGSTISWSVERAASEGEVQP